MPTMSSQSQVTLDANSNTVQCHPQALKAFSFLPWVESEVTFLEIPHGAQLVLTGPLSACTVWAFEANGTAVLVHANANSEVSWGQMSGAEQRTNLAIKMAAVNRIKAHFGGGGADLARLAYEQAGVHGGNVTSYQGYQGFVIGCKPRCGFSLGKVIGYGQKFPGGAQYGGGTAWRRESLQGSGVSSGSSKWTFYFYGYNGTGSADRVLWPLG
jgi:hypothetical protein